MFRTSGDPKTLKAFDMVLSISQEAINNQLELLYRTPTKALPLPLPGTTQPKTEYLISHQVSMHSPEMDGEEVVRDENNNIVYREVGIDGWIKAPRVSILQRRGVAKMYLTFCSNPDVQPGQTAGDTVYSFWKGEGRKAELKSMSINDWTLSWEADLSSTEITQMDEDKTALPGNVKQTLKAAVDSKDFTVASIFCLMESTKLVNTFELRDNQGANKTGGQMGVDFIKALIEWLKFEKPDQQSGIPTRTNPFILGYGISQTPLPTPGVPLFIPRRYQFSTSAEADNVGSALNFCIVTEDASTVNMNADANAGNFVPSLMKQLNLNATEADGVMGLSQGIFFKHFIKPTFVENFGLDLRDNVQPVLQGSGIETWMNQVDQKPREYRMVRKWRAQIKAHNTSRGGLLIQERTFFDGDDLLSVTWSSDPVPVGKHADNIQRRFYIDVRTSALIVSRTQSNTRGGLDSLWSDVNEAHFLANLRARYRLYANEDGKWIIELDMQNSFLPQLNGQGKVDYANEDPKVFGKLGIYAWAKASGFFGIFGGAGEDKMLEQLRRWGSVDVRDLNRRLDRVTSSFNTKIIMPAGNVFMFKGMNADDNGALYSPITYKSLTNGEKIVNTVT